MALPQIDIASLPDLPEQAGIHGSRKSDDGQVLNALPNWIIEMVENMV